MAVLSTKYRHYPELVRTCCLRPYRYNRCLDAIEKWEDAGRLFVIRPTMQPVKRLENNTEKLEAFYDHGYEIMKQHYDAMQRYLEQ